MQKKASKEAKDNVNFNKEMQKIEAAALKAYANDVKSNADFTSQLILSGNETLPVPEIVEPEPKPKMTKPKVKKKDVAVKKWMEALSDDGRTYFWNVDTGESVWEPPSVGFASLNDQKRQKSNESDAKNIRKGNKSKKGKKQVDSSSAGKKSQVEESKKPEAPIFQSRPIGSWQKVETDKEEKFIDLQLPRQELIPISVPRLRDDFGGKFKEKVFAPETGFAGKQEIGFKKRKIASDTKKNIRQRIGDD